MFDMYKHCHYTFHPFVLHRELHMQQNGDMWHPNLNLIFLKKIVNEIKFGPLKVRWTRFCHVHQGDEDMW